jgi:hypothetical protein
MGKGALLRAFAHPSLRSDTEGQNVTPALLRDCERSKGRGRVGPVDKSPTLGSNAGSSGAVPVDGKLQAGGMVDRPFATYRETLASVWAV